VDVFSIFIIAFVWAMLPLFLYAILLQWVTWGERQFSRTVGLSILWGVPPAFAFMGIVAMIALNPWTSGWFSSGNEMVTVSVIVPVLEESLKLLSILTMVIIYRRKSFHVVDGLIYGSMVGLGFSVIEDFWYYASFFMEEGTVELFDLMLVRGLVGSLNHSVYSSIAGLGLGLAYLSPRPAKWFWASFSLTLAIIIHAFYNFTAFVSDDSFLGHYSIESQLASMVANSIISALGVLLVVVVVFASWKSIRLSMEEKLNTEAIPAADRENLTKLSRLELPPLLPFFYRPPATKKIVAEIVKQRLA